MTKRAQGPRWIALPIVVWLFAPAPASAQRLALMVDTELDATPVRAGLESKLTSRLARRTGLSIVDERYLAKLREQTSGKEIFAGARPDVVSSLEADALVAGALELRTRAVGWVDATGLRAELTLVALTADRATVIASTSVSWSVGAETFADITQSKAIDEATERALAWFDAEVTPSLREGPRTMEVVVHHTQPLEASALAKLRDHLGSTKGVRDVTVVATPERSVFRLLTGNVASDALAIDLDASPGLGVRLRGFSRELVEFDFATSRASLVFLRSSRFRGRAVDASMLRLAERTLFGAVEALEFVAPLPRGRTGPSLRLSGSIDRVGHELLVRAELRVRPDGKALVVAQSECHLGTLVACLRSLSDELANLTSQRYAEIFAALEVSTAVARGAAPVNVRAVELDGIFPANALAYASFDVGRIRLARAAGVGPFRARVRASLDDYQRGARVGPWVASSGASDIVVPIMLDVDASMLGAISSETSVRSTLQIQIESEGYTHQVTAQRRMLVFSANAIDWSNRDGATVAGFVDAAAPSVVSRAQLALKGATTATDTVELTGAIYAATSDLEYRGDRHRPFDAQNLDEVQYAPETLHLGRGDCDDLSVAFASVAAAAGLDVVLLVLPTHVIPAVSFPKEVSTTELFDGDVEWTLEHRGRRWLPLEVTQRKLTFAEAWRSAARQVHATRGRAGEMTIVEVTGSEATTPGFRRDLSGRSPPTVRDEAVRGAMRGARTLRRTTRDARIDTLSRSTAPDDQSTLGAMLARLGRYREAQIALQKAYRGDKSSVAVLSNLGNLRLLSGAAKEALELQRRALEAHPAPHFHVRCNAIVAAVRSGQIDLAGKLLATLEENQAIQFFERFGGIGDSKGAVADDSVNEVRNLLLQALRSKVSAQKDGIGQSTPLGEALYWVTAVEAPR